MCVFRVAGSPASEKKDGKAKAPCLSSFNATCSFRVKSGVLHLDFEEKIYSQLSYSFNLQGIKVYA